MLNEKAYTLGSKRSVIRELFEYAKMRSEQIGAENVFDFSIGNPSVPAPTQFTESILRSIRETPAETLHAYTSAQGDKAVRDKLADSLNKRFGSAYSGDNLYMTCGAAASLTICLHALYEQEDEIIVFAPYFPEYRVFVEGSGAKLVVVGSDKDTLLPDFDALEKSINSHTKAVIVNSPNNPSGVVYGEQTVKRLAALLASAKRKYGHTVYLISDEPYRELVYNEGESQPFIANFYEHTLTCYSYSKSLSIPGERVGYIAVNPRADGAERIYAALCGAGRELGYVCAPALFQKAVAECDGLTSDLSVYKRNRDLLYNALTEYGFECIYPQGAFYLFMKAPELDANAFCERAKKHELLFVPSDDFGYNGFVRIAYCVATERIERALPAFKKLAEEYGL